MEVEHEVLQFVERQRALLLLEKQAEADEAARYGTPRIGANRMGFLWFGSGSGSGLLTDLGPLRLSPQVGARGGAAGAAEARGGHQPAGKHFPQDITL